MAGSTGAGGLIEFDISVSVHLGRNGRAIVSMSDDVVRRRECVAFAGS